MTDEPLLVLCTCHDQSTAMHIAETLVSEELAACVSMLPGVTSVYRWQGKLESAQEIQLLIKTRAGVYDDLASRVRVMHPYELPEIIAVPVSNGLDAYLDWIQASTGGGQ